MIISHKHRFVFIHNPKVAGSAVRKAIEHLHDDPTVYWHQQYVPELERVVDASHLTLNDLKICRPDLAGYTFFGFHRDTFKRYASAYYEHCRQHLAPAGLTQINEWSDLVADETNFRFNWKYVHFCPQHYFNPLNYREFTSADSLWLNYETIEESFAYLTETVAGLQGCKLPMVRQRPDVHQSLFENMNMGTIRKISTVYARDLDFMHAPVYTNHYERINGIRNPNLSFPLPSTLTAGELLAYNSLTPTVAEPAAHHSV